MARPIAAPKYSPSQTFLQRLSAGLITGAADDDPSGIATYAQVGAKFGYATLWTIFLTMPLMIAVQVVAARIGRVSGFGLFDNLQKHYSNPLVCGLACLLIIANVINLGADIGAMGAALKLLIGGPAIIYALAFALVSLLLQVFVPFSRYSPYLKVLTISLFAYVATVFVVKVPWGDVLKGTLIPRIQWTGDYAMAVVAVFGTTISPYLFSWQAAQEVEEIRASSERKALKSSPHQGDDALQRIQVDTVIGMMFSNIVAFFIILTAAVTLHAHGKLDIQSSAEAAEALRPIAGRFAFWLFAAGIIGTGLLALPVLAGATAYAVAGALHKPYGLERTPMKAKAFYGVLIVAMIIGAGLNMTAIDPIKALYWTAVINGVAAVPIMVLMLLLSNNKDAMGEFCVKGWTRWLGWLAMLIMAVAAVVMFASMGKSS
ncbi:divalent metal cation transporter [Dyella monticola]|uniref:Divalent metal cation transporter n=1 Tax=Dyella monticola TaxID=1927958 RepID=A0A370X1K4_9GAMM|nr:divalent metal cation transporter [Dyella monticola]RDS82293.1 divalent metal cation transporter [Dyella monticola]